MSYYRRPYLADDAARCIVLIAGALIGLATPAIAQTRPTDLTQVSIEDLMTLEVTSVARRGQRAADAAAAIFVITHEDIVNSGMTTLPDLLRLVPGTDVAQINANKAAVSVRGFNALYANKLLVLVDGRSVYNLLFSGVLWDTEDMLLDDIDRIEVIRGPGAALWGANAVNGVVNIVTKSAADTAGTLVRVDGGGPGAQAAARYGGTLGSGAYRVYSQWTERSESLTSGGAGANDASHSVTSGFRADWQAQPGTFVVEGAFTAGQARALWPNFDPNTAAIAPIVEEPSDTHGAYVLGRWTHTRPGGATLQVQSFLDIAARSEPVGVYDQQAVDVDVQYHTAVGRGQDIVAGAGYRYIDEGFEGRNGISLVPEENHSTLLTAFLQDEIAMFRKRLAITIGTQTQYDSDAGAGIQPTARAIWTGLPRQRIWASTSRALRTPSLDDRGIHVDYPPAPGAALPLFVAVRGNPDAQTETLADLEAGYRLDFGAGSLDVTGFAGHYDGLVTQEVEPPLVQFAPSPRIVATSRIGNLLEASTRGLEIAGRWSPAPAWRLDGSYTAFHVTPQLSPASLDPQAAATDTDAPRVQWQLRATFAASPRATFHASLFHVGALEQTGIDAYSRLDVTARWALSARLSAMIIGQNLLASSHLEFDDASSLLMTTRVPRSLGVRLRWSTR